jgi:transcriptional antiterminator NusG
MTEENSNENAEETTKVEVATEAVVAETTETPVEGEEQEERIFAIGDTPEFKWFIAHALSGFENRVTKTLTERIINNNLTEFFAEIVVPEETVMTNVNGKKRKMRKKFFPGYVMIKMIMTDHTWHIVKNTDKITGFIGGTKNKPAPISDAEATAMLGQVQEGASRPRTSIDFDAGDSVKVIEGPFASFVGTVESVNEKGKVKVSVSIFGRPTPVELDFSQVEKV